MSDLHRKFGELLKSERVRKGISIDDMSEKLKISISNLESIENGTPEDLPSELYFKLFSKSYSESLGIDYERTLDAMKDEVADTPPLGEKTKKTEPAESEEASDTSEEKESFLSSNPLLKKLIYIFGGIVLVFFIFLTVNKIFFSGDLAESDSRDELSSEVAKEDDRVNTEEMAAFNWDNNEYKKPEKIKLRLLPRDQSWATIIADGDTAIYRTLNANRIYDVEADFRLLVSVGVPSVVTVELNGKAVDLRNTSSGRISRVEINQMNLASFLNREQSPEENNTTINPAGSKETSSPPVGTEETASIPSTEKSDNEGN